MTTYTINDIEIFADGLDHPECVAVDRQGVVWAGGEAGQIYRIDSTGSWQEVANTGGFNLGLAFSPAGWLAICDLKGKKIWKLDPQSLQLTVWASGAEGEHFMTPNFIVFNKAGGCFVSDSGEFRKHNGRVFYFRADGSGQIWHSGPFRFANGMALSADQQTLYVVSTWLPGVETVSIKANGEAGERKVLVELPQTCPDGIAIDEQGSIFISCYAPNKIYQLNASGHLSELVSDWESHTLCNPTNIAFGGIDGRDLYIANLGRWHIARLRMKSAGLKLTND